MLNFLSINNFVLIDKFEQQFNKGMTTVTGETGAGKSIILDALSLLIGGRGDAKYFRGEETKISLLAEFSIENNIKASDFLKSKDFDTEDGACIVRRVLTKEGKSKAYINSIACTVSDLKKLGSFLIEIHSQHKNQELLSSENQLKIIDAFSNLREETKTLRDIYQEYNKKDNELRDILSKRDEAQSKLQLLNYKYNELKELDLKENEIQDLEKVSKTLGNAENIIQNCYESIEICSGEDSSLINLISSLKQNLECLDSESENVQSIFSMIDTIQVNAEELTASLNMEKESYAIDPERLQMVTHRLEKAYTIARKNYILPEKLYDYFLELEKEIKSINVSDEDLEERYKELEELKIEWLELAKQISEKRKLSCDELSGIVTESLYELKMEGSDFKASLESDEAMPINEKGIDNIQFLLRSNLGQPLQPIAKVASGGELSRISLSIQSIVSKHYDIPTLVFDEVDTGIGGTTGNVIGKCLKRISKTSQVICITHLPQVTVFGDQYLTVKKENKIDKTIVKIKYLNDHDLVNEVGRMIGNEILDGEAIAQAKKMIQSAKEF